MSDQSHELFSHKVEDLTEIAEGIFILSFKRNDDFKAGQVVAMTVDNNDEPRLYSIASGEKEEFIRILFNVVPYGKLTNQLSKLKKGDEIYVSRPFGKYIGTDEPAYWIAAGTGIAPFASMFYSGRADNKFLIHGGRWLESFYFEEDFKPYFKDRYVRCCSQQNGSGVYNGRLTTYLKTLDHFKSDYKYYLCGSTEMVVETRDILISKGVPFDQIVAEIYF